MSERTQDNELDDAARGGDPGRFWPDAGRSLDAEIEERLFGWHRVMTPPDIDGENAGEVLVPPGVPPWEREPPNRFQLPTRGRLAFEYFVSGRYSTDVREAFGLLTYFARQGHKVNVMTRFANDRVWACGIILNPGQPNERHVFEYGDTPPHAIALAALKTAADATTPKASPESANSNVNDANGLRGQEANR